jgi:Na+/melibiose symporter-like transporter
LISTDVFDNATDSKFNNNHQNDTQITVLYPLVGFCIVIMSLGYLLLAVKNHKQVGSVTVDSKVKAENNSLDSTPIKLNLNQRVLVIVMIIFFFFYCGSEGTFGIYLVVFSVKSSLKLPKLVGAQIASTFWGCFAAMRFVSIFAAIFLKPIYVMSMSCLVSIIGSILLVLYGSQSVTILWAGCAMFGFGIASMYATGLLWLKSHMKLTNRIGKHYGVIHRELELDGAKDDFADPL